MARYLRTALPIQRCGRPTKTGRTCNAWAYWNSPACFHHTTEAEFASLAEHLEQPGAEVPAELIKTQPGCWAWPVVEQVLTEAATVMDEFSHASRAAGILRRWQGERCAICAPIRNDDLVLDHDHASGLIRGWLCRGCNVAEGASSDEIFRGYRERNPATMLGIRVRYYSAFTGWAKEEAPPAGPDQSPAYLLAALYATD